MADSETGIWAAVPVKAFHQAKSRLSPALPASVRESLAKAMLVDVLGAIAQSSRVQNTLVITADPYVSSVAQEMGAQVLQDQHRSGQTAAVEQALRALQAIGCSAMLTLPGDLPLIKPQEIDAICDLLQPKKHLVIAPAGNDGGTNALLCTLPTSMQFHFGEDSFAKHVKTAAALNLDYVVADIEGFRLDLDRPQDLEDFMMKPSKSHAYSFLNTAVHPEVLGGSLGQTN